MPVTYPLDLSGNNPNSKVQNELHSVNEGHFRDYFFIVPEFAPFYVDNFVMTVNENGNVRTLIEDVDFSFALPYITGTRVTGKQMYGAITLHQVGGNASVPNSISLSGILSITYQTVGGDQVADKLYILTTLADKAYNPRTTIWDILTNVPTAFPPTPHYQDYDNFKGQEDVINKLGEIRDAILDNASLTNDKIQDFIQLLQQGNSAFYVKKSGDTMDGPLTLHGAPLNPNHAATKTYVDNLFNSVSNFPSLLSNYVTTSVMNTNLDLKLDKTGGIVTGPLSLTNDPTDDYHAANKKYVDMNYTDLDNRLISLQGQVDNMSSTGVTKAYVDNLFNELSARFTSILK